MSARAAGLLLHPSSLPSAYGIGDCGPAAYRFLDFLEESELTLWQILPLGPTGGFNSPYGCLSAFAGNPLLISPEGLVEEGLLPKSVLAKGPAFSTGPVDFAKLIPWKREVLRGVFERFELEAPAQAQRDFEAFREDPFQKKWLPDFALFSALLAELAGEDLPYWPQELRRREPTALADARERLADEILFREFVQFLFFRQWDRLKADANRRGIRIVGDVPIYVALSSADVWENPGIFQLDEDLRPLEVAGVPPDYFSEDGQLWGNPLYRWDVLAEQEHAWWADRLTQNLRLADLVRIDHFRGFAGYWSVPADAKTARAGRWAKGPGVALFDSLRKVFPELPLIAEDLGVITPDVKALLEATGLPGMKVLQFAFGKDDDEYLPHNHGRNSVVYSGTHDNDTALGWYRSAPSEEKERALAYLGGNGRRIWWDLVRSAFASPADTAIVPVQDLLGLGSESRLNTPGVARGNWSWRLEPWALSQEVAAEVAELSRVTGRSPRTQEAKAAEALKAAEEAAQEA
ncbi:MAG: 4-alpha-glucanotransferase [Acidobacteria bacterium]|nr:4-alpha-glucanotransferase [Acidobacteriota bacterium]